MFEVEGGLRVGAAVGVHITDIGGARTAREDREDIYADQIPPEV